MFKQGDKVLVADNAEECCCAEDAGLVGVVVKVKRKDFNVVKTTVGVWNHCDKCITLIYDKKVTAPKMKHNIL